MDESLMKREPIGCGKEIFVSKNHTFGTDAVLLGRFASARRGDSLIDLGTGCGIIPFLIMRDTELKEALGVDISREAIDLCERSADLCGFSAFKTICSDLADLKGKTEFGCYSLVTCNPPYKAAGAGILSETAADKIARHETECTLEGIISVAARLLKSGGRLCMCHRPERLAELVSLMSKHGIEPKKLRLVCKKVGTEPWLVLVEGKRSAKVGLRVAPTLYLYENGELTKEMREIYGPYKGENQI